MSRKISYEEKEMPIFEEGEFFLRENTLNPDILLIKDKTEMNSEKKNFIKLKAEICQKYSSQSVVKEDSNSRNSINTKNQQSYRKSAQEIMQSKAIYLLNKKIEKYKKKLDISKKFIDHFLLKQSAVKSQNSRQKSRRQLFALVKLLLKNQIKTNGENTGREINEKIESLKGLLNQQIELTMVKKKSETRIFDNFKFCLIKSSQKLDVIDIHEDLPKIKQDDINLNSSIEIELEVVQFKENSQIFEIKIDLNKNEESAENNNSNKIKLNVKETNQQYSQVLNSEDLFNIQGLIEICNDFLSNNKIFDIDIREKQSKTILNEMNKMINASRKFPRKKVREFLLFKENQENYNEFELQKKTGVHSFCWEFQFSSLIFKFILLVVLIQNSQYLEIPIDMVHEFSSISFHNREVELINQKFTKIIFGDNKYDEKMLENAFKVNKNPFSVFHNFFNSLFFALEKNLLFSENSNFFERRELAKKTQTSAFKGGCAYIIMMKELEEIKVVFSENPNDLILSFVILFSLPQIKSLNHAFAKILREVFFNIKFRNTMQELLVLFISRNLIG